MNKTLSKIIIILIVFIIFWYGFSNSYYSNSITNISYVTAMGIDLSEDKEHLKITFEFMDASPFAANSSPEETPPVLDTITANSISSAINLLDSYIGKQANLSHCKIIVFSKDIAEKGIGAQITELMNNIQIRPSTNLLVSRCEAKKYIENTTSSLEKVLTKYYDIFPNSSEYTGYTSNVTIGEFYNHLVDDNSGNIAILGGVNPEAESAKSQESGEQSSSEGQSSESGSQSSGGQSSQSGSQSSSGGQSSGGQASQSGGQSSDSQSSSESQKPSEEDSKKENVNISKIVAGDAPIEGDRGAESIGIAVFKKDKYIGELTALESLCHSILTDEVETFTISIDDKEIFDHYIDLYIFHNTNNVIKIDISGDTPIININCQFKGKILGTKNDNEISKNIDLKKLSEASSKYLEKILTEYLNKTSSKFECDITDFYYSAKKNFLTTKQWEDFDWSSKYKNAKFNVHVSSNISYNLFNSNE